MNKTQKIYIGTYNTLYPFFVRHKKWQICQHRHILLYTNKLRAVTLALSALNLPCHISATITNVPAKRSGGMVTGAR